MERKSSLVLRIHSTLTFERRAVGAIAGPAIGGAFADRGLWRWVFWLNLPPCGFALFVIALFATLKPISEEPTRSDLGRIDVMGYFLFTASLVSVLLGLTWVSHPAVCCRRSMDVV